MNSLFDHIDKRTALIGAVTVFIFGALLIYLFSQNDDTPDIERLDASAIDAALGRELLSTLARLKATALDTSIFTDPVFTSLHDFGVEIAPQPVGRRNPFASFVRPSPPKTTGGSSAASRSSTPASVPPSSTRTGTGTGASTGTGAGAGTSAGTAVPPSDGFDDFSF